MAQGSRRPGQAGRQLDHEVAATLNKEEKDIADAPVQAPALAALINRIIDGTISNKIARECSAPWAAGENGGQPDAIIERARPGRHLGAAMAQATGQAIVWRQLDHGRGRRHAQQGRKDIADAPVQAPPGRADQPHHRRHHLNKIAREVFGAMWAGETAASPAIIEARGLKRSATRAPSAP